MNPGEGRSFGRDRPARVWAPCLLVCAILTGCATDRAAVEKYLANRNGPACADGVAECYRLGCSDVLDVRIRNRPELSGPYVITPTGRIELRESGSVRVEGRTPAEVAGSLAAETGQPPADVAVQVAAFRSQYLFLSGQVFGRQRTVPYQGQETVLDLLRRAGGITSGAELGDVYVVRTHLEQGTRPEVFHVNLKAIVMKQDERTNLRLLPFDQVYVGESRQAQFEKAFPPWLRPIYQVLWNILPEPERTAPPVASEAHWETGS